MNIEQLNEQIYIYSNEKENTTLSLSQLEDFLNGKNIYFRTVKNFFSKNELECYLIILVDETWYFATGSPYYDQGLNFDFYIENYFFAELKTKDIKDLHYNLEQFNKMAEDVITLVEDPNASRKITLEKMFSSKP